MITVLALHLACYVLCNFIFYDRLREANISFKSVPVCITVNNTSGLVETVVHACSRYIRDKRNSLSSLKFTMFIIVGSSLLCFLVQAFTRYVVFWCIKQALYVIVLIGSLWYPSKFNSEKVTTCSHQTDGMGLLRKIVYKAWCVLWCELRPRFVCTVDIDNISTLKRGALLRNICFAKEGKDPQKNPITSFSFWRILVFNLYNAVFALIIAAIVVIISYSGNVKDSIRNEMLVRVVCAVFGGTNFYLTFVGWPTT